MPSSRAASIRPVTCACKHLAPFVVACCVAFAVCQLLFIEFMIQWGTLVGVAMLISSPTNTNKASRVSLVSTWITWVQTRSKPKGKRKFIFVCNDAFLLCSFFGGNTEKPRKVQSGQLSMGLNPQSLEGKSCIVKTNQLWHFQIDSFLNEHECCWVGHNISYLIFG